jgi:hypothetical protein
MSEEEVTTYSGLVRILRERIAGYVRVRLKLDGKT